MFPKALDLAAVVAGACYIFYFMADKPRTNKYPAQTITLEFMVNKLVEVYGWDRLGQKIQIRCFNDNPSVKSSLKFLRKTPWARSKVENLYKWRDETGWDPRDNVK